MRTTYDPKFEPILRSEMSVGEVSRLTGMRRQNVYKWRQRIEAGLPMPTEQYHTNYPLIDKLLAEGKRHSEIARLAGCSKTAVSRRARGIDPSGRVKEEAAQISQKEPPLILPADRLPRAVKVKMKGWTPEHREAFLASQEGAKWAAQIQGAA